MPRPILPFLCLPNPLNFIRNEIVRPLRPGDTRSSLKCCEKQEFGTNWTCKCLMPEENLFIVQMCGFLFLSLVSWKLCSEGTASLCFGIRVSPLCSNIHRDKNPRNWTQCTLLNGEKNPALSRLFLTPMVQEIFQLLVQMDCISYCASSYQRIYLGIARGWRCLRILGYSVWFSLNAFFLSSCQTAPLLGQMLWLRVCSLSLVCPHFGVGVQRLQATLLSIWSESSFCGCALPHPPSSWETHS